MIKKKKKKGIYFIRDKFFELEQEAQDSSELRRYNIYLEPKEQYNTWIDVLNIKKISNFLILEFYVVNIRELNFWSLLKLFYFISYRLFIFLE